jgi:CheY-like chemotaxis protein
MPYRVQDILLVSSLYDSFTLQEDGRLNELILGEFLELSLHHAPGLTHLSSGVEALERVKAERRFNLVITTLDPGDMDAAQLAREVKRAGLDVPVVVLAYDYAELKEFLASRDTADIEDVFLWQGNARILVAIVKCVEDRRNVAHDTAVAGVRVILVVEDNIRHASSFLPTIYTELLEQSARVVSEGVNLSHKLVRLRARPKILLSRTFESAWENVTRYGDSMLGLISDIQFPRGGRLSPEAGFELAGMARDAVPGLPIVLHSSHPEYAERAASMAAAFLRKGSETLLTDLRRFMVEHFGLGDFVFRLPSGAEVARAGDLKRLEEKLHDVPVESIAYHAERNHFSNWFTARTEFALAHKFRPRTISDFPSLEALRRDLIASIADYRREQSDLLVSDFDAATFEPSSAFFARIGSGSLGGKARGLAFVRYLLNYHRIGRSFPRATIAVPPAVVLATDVYDRFLRENGLLDFAIACEDDAQILARFLAAELPAEVVRDLAAFLGAVRWPLAVRSSSLLEDSQDQPFTGVYDTFMLPNNPPDDAARLGALLRAVKRVYASTFSRRAKAYLRATPYRLEEEKMAVIVQKVVGAAHGPRFYPSLAGVARSLNFYAAAPATPEDGIAAVALGLGRTVVEGERCVSFCPRYPRHILGFSTADDVVKNSQRGFWALELQHDGGAPGGTETMRETRFDLRAAEADGTLHAVGSTYSPENEAVYDGIARPGTRLVTFAPMLKHEIFPLAEILSVLLEISSRGMNRPAEIEFAVRLNDEAADPGEFGFLQMRPLVVRRETEDQRIDDAPRERILCHSPRVLGNGRLDDVRDLVVVEMQRFDRAHSREAAEQIARLNAELVAEGAPYVLIGVGRWGSMDPWLGIPVRWEEIAGARAIVEAGLRDVRLEPSQGSHFFQNLTAFEVGYFTVNEDAGEGFVDWDWIAEQPAVADLGWVRRIRFVEPLVVKMNGRRNEGVIYKPGFRPAQRGTVS